MRGLFFEREDEGFSAGFIDDGVLKEVVRQSASITVLRDKLHVHLPFDAKSSWSIVRLWLMPLLGGRSITGVAQSAINAVQ